MAVRCEWDFLGRLQFECGCWVLSLTVLLLCLRMWIESVAEVKVVLCWEDWESQFVLCMCEF